MEWHGHSLNTLTFISFVKGAWSAKGMKGMPHLDNVIHTFSASPSSLLSACCVGLAELPVFLHKPCSSLSPALIKADKLRPGCSGM